MADIPSETLFCKILENQYNTKIDLIDAAILLPIRAIRDVKSNITRVEKLVYTAISTELVRIENLLIEILFLDQINQLAATNNFCRVAFSCQKLVEVIVDSSLGYLSFLDATTRSQVSSDYALFEKHVCVLGLRNIVTNFTNDVLSQLRDRLVELFDELENQLRLDELKERYLEILENSGIFGLLNELKKFRNCYFGICDWAATSTNKLEEYAEKLTISETDTSAGWTENVDSLLDDYESIQTEIEDKINELIDLIDNRNPIRGIPKDETMKS